MIGFKYKMSNIQAALGCAQMERIDELVEGKRRIFQNYQRLLGHLPVLFNPEHEGTTNGYWMPTLVVDREVNIGAEELLDALRAKGIDARVFFHPLSTLGLIDRHHDAPCAAGLPSRAINLPSYHDVTEEEQARVARAIAEVMLRPRLETVPSAQV
jgi:perosamine synthetase